MTSLFIAVFLFFLSVALVWTNRQDIALSLSMEHKLKAQSAARSGAYEAFARLRQFGELEGYQGGTLPGGAEVKVELIGIGPAGKRGDVLQIRSRGTSGPVSSYLTLHLLDVRLAGEQNREDSRLLLFPRPATEPSEEQEQSEEASSKALYGDFVLREGGPGVDTAMVAQEGPIFARQMITETPPAFEDYLPVFSEDGLLLRGWGPTFVVAPESPGTALRRLVYQGEAFDWVEIEPPTELGDPEPTAPTEVFKMAAPGAGNWTTSSIAGRGTRVSNRVWTERRPPTRSASDIRGPVVVGAVQEAGSVVEWSSIGRVASPQVKFLTRGAIAARGDNVYTHGWHYLYRHYDGAIPSELTVVDGATFIRWPCILKYTAGGGWAKVWTPLTDDGTVSSEWRPDPGVLAVAADGTIYTVTEPDPEGESQRRLLTITGNSVKAGEPLPEGRLVVYREEPYLIPKNQEKAGLVNLRSGDRIDFRTLPDHLPEIAGEVVDVSGTEMMILGIEGGYAGEPLDSSRRLTYTARPRYDFRYSLPAEGPVAVDGDDLWAIIRIDVTLSEPAFEKGYQEAPFPEGSRTALARYDGERWHILPHGLRAILTNEKLAAPGGGVIAALYEGLPRQVNRYAIISVDTDPFGFGR